MQWQKSLVHVGTTSAAVGFAGPVSRSAGLPRIATDSVTKALATPAPSELGSAQPFQHRLLSSKLVLACGDTEPIPVLTSVWGSSLSE